MLRQLEHASTCFSPAPNLLQNFWRTLLSIERTRWRITVKGVSPSPEGKLNKKIAPNW